MTQVQDPASFSEAIQHECWIEAMNEELKALESNNSWTLADLP